MVHKCWFTRGEFRKCRPRKCEIRISLLVSSSLGASLTLFGIATVWIPQRGRKFIQVPGLYGPMGQSQVTLDDVDRGILFLLQEDARNTTIADIAEKVDVSASTVRNRLAHLEESGVIEGYFPKINYERAHYPLHVLFVCSASADEREELARQALECRGVVDVREMLTSTRNIFVEVVATDTRNMAKITDQLTSLGFSVESTEIITNHYTRPWAEFEFEDDGE